jgi:hypothetical protein
MDEVFRRAAIRKSKHSLQPCRQLVGGGLGFVGCQAQTTGPPGFGDCAQRESLVKFRQQGQRQGSGANFT